jgi:uncharacterized protein (DUF1499 family)
MTIGTGEDSLDSSDAGQAKNFKKRSNTRWKRKLLLVAAFSIIALYGLSMTSSRPSNLGVREGQLAECPDSPNCVSTQTDRQTHRMESLPFSGERDDAVEKIKQIVARVSSRVKLVEEKEGYLAYEFTSLMFRFIDDVEFLVDDEAGVVHFRSASRVGHSDLGANRRRMMKFSEEFNR